jgi:hypothetical protein
MFNAVHRVQTISFEGAFQRMPPHKSDTVLLLIDHEMGSRSPVYTVYMQEKVLSHDKDDYQMFFDGQELHEATKP